jgi:hypothetical protein
MYGLETKVSVLSHVEAYGIKNRAKTVATAPFDRAQDAALLRFERMNHMPNVLFKPDLQKVGLFGIV